MAKRTLNLNRVYQLLGDEENTSLGRDIPESAGRDVPANFFRQMAAMVATKTGDSLVNAKTVLAWLLSALGAPVAMIGWLVPLRESLSMLPQLVIAGRIRRWPRRKPIWLLGAVLQAAALCGMALVALTLTGAAAGWAILGSLIVFSLARGLCSVSSKDILGKTIPKGRRGRLNGLTTSVAGLTTIVLGAVALVGLKGVEHASWFAWPLAGAAGLWGLAGLAYIGVREPPGETDGGTNAWREAFKSLSLFSSDPPFRKFVLARALLLCSALSAPYFIVLARSKGETNASLLGAFVLGGGLAAAVSASFWGWWADRSSRTVLQWAGGTAALLGLLVFAMEHWHWAIADRPWTYPIAFFALNVAHSGVRVGRKTYVVDMAGGNKRTEYVAVSNSVIGAILLLTGSVGALSGLVGPEGIILILSLLGVGGSFLAWTLPEVSP